MRYLRTITFVGAVGLLSLAVFPVAAQITTIENANSDFGIAEGVTDVKPVIISAINVVLSLVGLIAIIMLIYGGFLYLTSAGEEKQTEKAKHTILYAIIGLIVIGLAAVIVNFVIGIFSGSGRAKAAVNFLVGSPAFAQGFKIVTDAPEGIPTGSLTDIILKVVNVFLGLVGLIAAIFLIYGGLLYITSAGDDKQTENAKHTILYAIVGLIVIGLAAVMVNFVIGIFGGGGPAPKP